MYPHTTEIDWVRVYKDQPLSVQENQINTSNFNLFPNPSQDYFWLEIPEQQKIVSLEIYDIKGRLIKQLLRKNTKKILVDVKDFAEGYYLVKTKTKQGSVSKKLIISKR